MNKEHIKKVYEKMLEYEGYKDENVHKINTYSCSCGNVIKTVDINNGVTPYMKLCKCGEFAKSNFYRDVAPNIPIEFEWYRPTLEETYRLSGGELDHVLKGGLSFRKTTVKQ